MEPVGLEGEAEKLSDLSDCEECVWLLVEGGGFGGRRDSETIKLA